MIPIRIETSQHLESNHAFRARIYRHLCRLSPDDRRLRFFSNIQDDGISTYVNRMLSSEGDGLFLQYSSDGHEVIGMLHVGRLTPSDPPEYELGISVDAEHRRSGIGARLFESAVIWLRAIGAKRVFMSCLYENDAMKNIVRKLNMQVRTEDGEHVAELDLGSAPDPLALVVGNAVNWFALYDLGVRRYLHATELRHAISQP